MSMSRFYPCGNCGREFEDHQPEAPKKCLFGPKEWKPQDYKHAKGSHHAFALKKKDAYKALIKAKITALNKEITVFETSLKAADQVGMDIRAACKHQHDDGTTALSDDFVVGKNCSICGWNDY